MGSWEGLESGYLGGAGERKGRGDSDLVLFPLKTY